MVFQKVVNTILEGCGLSPEGVQASLPFQRRKQHFLRLGDNLRGDAQARSHLAAGALRVGALLSGISVPGIPEGRLPKVKRRTKQPHTDRETQAEMLTWIRLLGDLAISAYVPCLPSYLRPWGNDLDTRELRAFTGSACQLAERWTSQTPDLRRLSLSLLMETLSPENRDRKSNLEDRADQPPERVLPRYFGPWSSQGSRHRANCLAKAIFLAAFARYAQVKKMLMVTPFTSVHRFRERARGRAAAAVLKSLEAMGFPWTPARLCGLRDIVLFGIDEEQERSFPHYSLACEVGDENWVLVDPNCGMMSELPSGWELSQGWSKLRGLRNSVPGASFFRFSEEPTFSDQVAHMDRVEAPLRQLFDNWRNTHSRDEAVRCLEESPLLDVVLQWPSFVANKLDPQCDRRRKAVCVLLEMNIWLYEWRKKQKKKEAGSGESPTEEFPCMWALRGESSTEELLSELSEDQARDAFLTLVFAIATRGIYGVEDEYEDRKAEGTLHPPACQFTLPGPGSAVPLLSQVALSLGEAEGDEMESLLCEQSFDIHRLTFAAGRKYRQLPSLGPNEALSIQILKALPQIPFSAARLLGVIPDHDTVVSTEVP